MFRKYRFCLLIIIVCILILTGCWDQVEINERVFIATIGFDTAPEGGVPQNKYKISYAFPNQAGGYGTDTVVTNAYMSTLASEIYSAERLLATRSNKSFYLGHLRVMVIGEEVARDQMMLREVLDSVERNPIISRRVSIGIVEGTAAEVLEKEPMMEGNVGQFLADVYRRKDRTQKAPLIDVGEALITLHENGNALMPRIIPSDKEVKVSGAAVIKDYKMVGWLGSDESNDVTIASGEIKLLVVPIPHMDLIIPLNITDGSSKFEYVETAGERKMVINIEMEGDIEMVYIDPKEDVLDPKFLSGLQDQANKVIRESMEGTIEKLQKEFNTDVLGFDRYLERHKPKVWEEIKGDWDEVFKNLLVEVNLDIKIRRVGLAR